MNVDKIRAWLMLQARPKSVRVSSEGATPQVIPIAEGTAWINLAQSVAALQPELVEALDAQGATIRAMRPAELDDDDEKEAEPDEAGILALQDPESVRLITFARLIADAYRHSTDVAFDKMIALFEASTQRSESLERALELTQKILTKAASDQLAVQIEQAAGGTGQASLFEQVVGAFLSGKMQGEAAKVVPTPPINGAAKPEATS